ncbi:hypothetical protein ACROYT_G014265 [Oculina patagonica]
MNESLMTVKTQFIFILQTLWSMLTVIHIWMRLKASNDSPEQFAKGQVAGAYNSDQPWIKYNMLEANDSQFFLVLDRKEKGKICIGSSFKVSHVTLEGKQTPEHRNNRVDAASSIGRLTCYADVRRLLSIVAMDYPYIFYRNCFSVQAREQRQLRCNAFCLVEVELLLQYLRFQGSVSVKKSSVSFQSSSNETVTQELLLVEVLS